MMYHVPVMIDECITGLKVSEDGTYVDATFGGGGHSRAIMKLLGKKGRLIGLDRDERALANKWDDGRLTVLHTNYRYIKRFLRLEGVHQVDGILADLGVSSHQFDKPERGFSIRFDEDLDMRMDRSQSKTAFEVVNTYDARQLQLIFERFGEVRNAKTLAAHIEAVRKDEEIRTTGQLIEFVEPCIRGNKNKYLAKVFQAIRIEVNDELESIKDFLVQSAGLLVSGGRLAVISYHSLEDRLVKNYFKKGVFEGEPEKDLFGRYEHDLKMVNKKPMIPVNAEITRNPRARSAKLRIAEKI